MNSRRNFFKNVLLAGASFAILPAAKFDVGSRLWKPDRQIVQERTGSIWSHYYLSWNETVPGSIGKPKVMGEVKHDGAALYYGTRIGWVRLKPLTRPLNWQPRMWIPTNRLGKCDNHIQLQNCWARDVEETPVPIELPDENMVIPEYHNCPV